MENHRGKKTRTKQVNWEVIPSSLSAKQTHNPIRKIVDGMKLTPNPEKEMIALSIGWYLYLFLFALYLYYVCLLKSKQLIYCFQCC